MVCSEPEELLIWADAEEVITANAVIARKRNRCVFSNRAIYAFLPFFNLLQYLTINNTYRWLQGIRCGHRGLVSGISSDSRGRGGRARIGAAFKPSDALG